MDAIDFFLIRYREFHGFALDELLDKVPERQVRTRPTPGVHTIAWLPWHTARLEDVGVNGSVADRPQVMDAGGWLDRMAIRRRDVGAGMSAKDVDERSAAIDLEGLRGYWNAVTQATLEVVEGLRGQPLDDVVPVDRVRRIAREQAAVAPGAEWLTEFWAKGRTRAWVLAQTPLLHVYGHSFEARAVKGLWGHPSP